MKKLATTTLLNSFQFYRQLLSSDGTVFPHWATRADFTWFPLVSLNTYTLCVGKSGGMFFQTSTTLLNITF